jgi:UDP-2-acetamido-3-amino-2,3-dideoxy-glucuronate N-acetyltransferase
MKYTKHSTSIIDDGAEIGDDSFIWHWSHICKGAKIGKNVSIGQNVYVANNVVIGDNCKIQNNVSVYDNVTLEDNVFCGPSMVFTNVYNPRAFIDRKNEYKNTLVKRGATLGANCTIVCGVTIGEYSLVGAGSLVNSNVKDFALVVGVPSSQIGWISKFGKRIELPLDGKGEFVCPHTKDTYLLDEMVLKMKNK